MESFSILMLAIGATPRGPDFMTDLPVEVAQLVLRKLDAESLMNAARVSTKWLAVCKSDPQLRRRVRRHLRFKRRQANQGGLPMSISNTRNAFRKTTMPGSQPRFKIDMASTAGISAGKKPFGKFSKSQKPSLSLFRPASFRI